MVKAVTGFTLFQTDADAGTNSAAHSSQLSQVSPAFQNSDPSSLLKVLEHRQSNNIKISAEQKEALLEATAKFEASEILKLKEDLNQEQPVRLQTFAGSVSKHGAEYGKRLMGEMLAQDPRALETWLNPISINQATAEGQITSSQRAQIAESFAANYNAGHPTLAVQEVPLDSQSKKAKASSVDLYLSLAHVQLPQAWYRTQATKTNHFLSFINSSQGPEANQFKKDYSRHVFKSYVESNGPSAAAASGISMHLMAESNSPTEVVEFFSQYSPGERSRIFDHMAASAFRFPIAEQSRYPHEAPKEFKDSFSLFMSSVAKAKGPQAEQLALELTDKFIEKEQYDIDLSGSSTEKLKKENPVYFERVRALGEVFKNHTKPILDKYTDYDSDIVGRMQSGFPEKQFQVDTKKLANLFRLTLFNPDCPQANTIRQNVLDYSEDLKTEINQAGEVGWYRPTNRLSMIMASTDYAIAQNYNKYQENQVAKAELLAFAINTGLSISAKKIPGAGPAASKLGKSIEAKLTDHLTDDRDFRAALKIAKENRYLDPETGFLREEDNSDFMSSLGKEQSHLVDITEARNILRKAFLSGFKTDQRMGNVDKGHLTILKYLIK